MWCWNEDVVIGDMAGEGTNVDLRYRKIRFTGFKIVGEKVGRGWRARSSPMKSEYRRNTFRIGSHCAAEQAGRMRKR